MFASNTLKYVKFQWFTLQIGHPGVVASSLLVASGALSVGVLALQVGFGWIDPFF